MGTGVVGAARSGPALAAMAGTTLGGGHTGPPGTWALVDPAGVSSVPTRSRQVALTFDDGPDPAFTPAVLDILASFRVTATFFVIGRNASAHPELVRAVIDAGHTVANHSQDHLWLDGQADPVVRDQLSQCEGTLRAAGAAPSGLFRPPRGWTSPGIVTAARELSLRRVYWSDCLEAHLGAGPTGAAGIMAGRMRAGSILLCHDGGQLAGPNPQVIDRRGTVEALPVLIKRILREGWCPVALPTLLSFAGMGSAP
jgi:chitooligosaccharide deacetylase